MNISLLKRKRDSITIEPKKKFTTNNNTVNFKDMCKETTKKQIDVLKLGKLVVRNISAVKLN